LIKKQKRNFPTKYLPRTYSRFPSSFFTAVTIFPQVVILKECDEV